MNQILFTETKKRKNPNDTKNIVLFFAVTLIVFGLVLSGQGIYGVYKMNESKQERKVENDLDTTIEFVQLATGEIQVNVNSKVEISELIYNWNNDASQTISENGKKSIQEVITSPAGENSLTVKTIDINGKQETKTDTFVSTTDKPDIQLSIIGDKIKITVNSKVDLSYVTYKWNSENEEKIEMTTYENKTMLEKELEIPRGKNTLIVKAMDINNNEAEKIQEIKGVTKPKSAPVIQGEYIYFEVTSDENITQVDFTFNGKTYIIKKEVIEASNQSKKVTYRLKLEKGMNYLKIKTTTESGVVGEDIWKYEYKKK